MTQKFHKRKKQQNSEDDWMTTYADAVTLLLCFLVLLISVSEPKESEFKKIQASFMKYLEAEVMEDPVEDLQSDIEGMVAENNLESMMSVEETEDGLVVEISSSSFFHPGSATFQPHAIPILLDLSLILEDFDYEDYLIEVEGHTDDTPMSGGGQFPSNWELSAARASGVVRFFIEENLSHERMRVQAFADTVPKVPNLDRHGMPIPENREINRRIAIKVERYTD